MKAVNHIEESTGKYQIVVYRDGDGVLHRRKITHKDNRIVWDRVIEEGA